MQYLPHWQSYYLLLVLPGALLAAVVALRLTEHQIRTADERIARLSQESAEAGTAATRLEEARKKLAPLAALREEASALDRQAEAFARRKGVLAQLEEVRRHLARIIAVVPIDEHAHIDGSESSYAS